MYIVSVLEYSSGGHENSENRGRLQGSLFALGQDLLAICSILCRMRVGIADGGFPTML